MAEGDELRALIERLRTLGPRMAEETAREAAPLVEAAARATAAAGTDPYGNPWRAKKDGSRAMPNAAANVYVETAGPVVQILTRGGHAIQNALGGDSRRRVIPGADQPLPAAISSALAEGAARAFRRMMGG